MYLTCTTPSYMYMYIHVCMFGPICKNNHKTTTCTCTCTYIVHVFAGEHATCMTELTQVGRYPVGNGLPFGTQLFYVSGRPYGHHWQHG